MNRGKLILKMACLAGYLLFTGFSAYFTASSLSLNLLNGTNLWLIFVLVLIVAIIASWCLTNVIGEMHRRLTGHIRFQFNRISPVLDVQFYDQCPLLLRGKTRLHHSHKGTGQR